MLNQAQRPSANAGATTMVLQPLRPPKRGAMHGADGGDGRSVPAAPKTISLARAVTSILRMSFLAWREKRFAVRISGELLKLHAIVSSRHPNLAGRDLYRQIVAVHTGSDAASIDAVLEGAEQSFADWPAGRDLKFCDIVNYLAASEFFASHQGNRWIQTDIKHIIAARIPRDL